MMTNNVLEFSLFALLIFCVVGLLIAAYHLPDKGSHQFEKIEIGDGTTVTLMGKDGSSKAFSNIELIITDTVSK